MASTTTLFGPLGRQVAIPYPLTGMTVTSEATSEESTLLSGGLNVYRAPTTHKSYSMNYKGGVSGLQPLVDMHAGMYGRGPFYMIDPLAEKGNLLPTRWASPWQLTYIANGWCDPLLGTQSDTPEGQLARFTGNSIDSSEGLRIAVPVVPGQPMYLKAWGSVVGGAGVRVYRLVKATGEWQLVTRHVPTLVAGSTTLHIAANSGLYSAYKFVLYAPSGTTLSLYHMDVSTTPPPTDSFRSGQGVGALQFVGELAGNVVSSVSGRIGLSVNLKEIERDANL